MCHVETCPLWTQSCYLGYWASLATMCCCLRLVYVICFGHRDNVEVRGRRIAVNTLVTSTKVFMCNIVIDHDSRCFHQAPFKLQGGTKGGRLGSQISCSLNEATDIEPVYNFTDLMGGATSCN